MSDDRPTGDEAEIEIEPGGPCCSCKEPIELGYMVVDEDGYRYCEGCWQPMSDDRLDEIKARQQRIGETPSNESFDSEDVFALTLEDVPWLIVEVERLRIADTILREALEK